MPAGNDNGRPCGPTNVEDGSHSLTGAEEKSDDLDRLNHLKGSWERVGKRVDEGSHQLSIFLTERLILLVLRPLSA